MEWIKPESYYDPGATWVTEEKAYDEKTDTAATCSVPARQWSGFLEFHIDPTYISKIRFWANYHGIAIKKIDLDAYYKDEEGDDTWNDVFEGDFLDETWVEKDLASVHFLNRIRVRFYNNNLLFKKTARLFEIELYETIGVPVLTTWDAINVEDDSATLQGEITHLGGEDVTERGFEYKLSTTVDADSAFGQPVLNVDDTTGFSNDDTILIGEGTDREEEATILSIQDDISLTLTTDLIYTHTSDQADKVESFWEVNEEEDTFETEIYELDITDLTPDANYHFRAYAVNVEGRGYGEWKSFSSDVGAPVLTTSAATDVTHGSALLHGEIINTNGENAEERGFEYKEGEDGEVDKVYETGDFNLGVFERTVDKIYELDELKPNVLYYFRSYAKNSAGIGYGTWLDFTTDKTSPTVETNEATEINQNDVQANGEIMCTGGEANLERGFEYGLTKDAAWTEKVVVGGYPAGEFHLTIDNLEANTEYWYRAYSKNTVDPFYGYGEWIKFITAAVGIIPLGRKNDICSDYRGYSYILNRSLLDDDEIYESFFVLSTDLSGKQTLHINKRLLDLWVYFDIREVGFCQIYIKEDNEPDWQYAGEVEMTGEGEIIIKHLPVDYLAKHFLIKFVFETDFKFVGCIFEFIPKGER